MTIMAPPNLVYKRDDVVLVLFPNSTLTSAKPRPALVIQADNLQTGLPQIIIAMITSRTLRVAHPSRVLISLSTPEGKRSGLLMDSVVMTENLDTVIETAINRVVGALPMANIDAVYATR